MLDVPARFKSAVMCITQLFALAEAACVQRASDEAMPFADLQRALAVGAGELLRVLHQPILTAMARSQPGLTIGGVRHRRAGRSAATDYTLAGPVSVTRWRYRPEGAPHRATVDPIAVRVGSVHGTCGCR